MSHVHEAGRRKAAGLRLPSHAFLLAAFLPALAAVARIALQGHVGTWSLLVWLAGLAPVFLLTRYMGWAGALLGLTWTSAMVVLAELFAATVTGGVPDWSMVGLIAAVTASVALGAGLNRQWWSERRLQALAEMPVTQPETSDLPAGDILVYFIDKLFEAARRRPPLTVVLLEVDKYEDYVRLYGEKRAREAIGVAVSALQSRTRASNVYGRVDDRTLVVLLHGEGLTAAHALATRVLEEVEALPAPWSGRITLSTGIAGFDPSMRSSEALLAQARQALETARRMGGDRIVVAQGASEETLVTSGMTVLRPDGQVKEIRSAV
jgi:diguanylate cyclase (GGDEF)-like protein